VREELARDIGGDLEMDDANEEIPERGEGIATIQSGGPGLYRGSKYIHFGYFHCLLIFSTFFNTFLFFVVFLIISIFHILKALKDN
jgi:hypothetical protein